MSEAKTPARPVNIFTIPSKLAKEAGVSEVGMITLLAQEEVDAAKRGAKDNAKIAAQLVLTSLVEADGKKLSLHDGSVDSFWNQLDPRVRQLLMTAYAELHAADEADETSFLESRKVRMA